MVALVSREHQTFYGAGIVLPAVKREKALRLFYGINTYKGENKTGLTRRN
jgi:hypothetical protein